MKFTDLLSTELPEIDDSVKECINLGQWMLFRADAKDVPDRNIEFFLKVGKDLFALGHRGEVLTVFSDIKRNIDVSEIIYFSDLPKPKSLSNIACCF
ncbi:TPA: hypothetical protein I8374_002070 [Serratia marcescens]|uniref:hypothetical protein n=1 Tax=Serratia TaxID=613 RepID=UPI000F7DD43F|nr:hypothetical protein [Serratia marcescens]MBE8813614.1 hypothetical protein [Serratia marcescens]MBH2708101.1 hypothetical protein [Serratia marcescens]QKO37053.1 hypothetical protein F0335_18710 [Serratia marcescens]RTF18718.1 hypothetical protein D9B84_15020 [Serratia marcescens]HAT2867636.1 hypothetical protein [Serratia marcescens]